jgi:hypothetical protein
MERMNRTTDLYYVLYMCIRLLQSGVAPVKLHTHIIMTSSVNMRVIGGLQRDLCAR